MKLTYAPVSTVDTAYHKYLKVLFWCNFSIKQQQKSSRRLNSNNCWLEKLNLYMCFDTYAFIRLKEIKEN